MASYVPAQTASPQGGRTRAALKLLSAGMLLQAASATATGAQRQPPLVGTVAPGAIGAPAPTPAPIGGLRTRPLSASPAEVRAGRPPRVGYPRVGYPRVGYPRVLVMDAPRALHGVVVTDRSTASQDPPIGVWTPTAEPPRWVVDSSAVPVQAWRDLIVTDHVCSVNGVCVERRQRLRARWIARCACYAFADGWNRIWRVD